jgi:PAS domain S-box-containing protein
VKQEQPSEELAQASRNSPEKSSDPNTRGHSPVLLARFLFVMLLALFVLIGAILVRFESDRNRRQEVENVQQTLDGMKASLASRLYANIHKVSAVKALVAMDPDLTQDDFARAMEVQFRGDNDLRNIGLARDMVIQFMYPVASNEAAVGLDYTTLPDQFEAVELARRVNEIVLAGPLALVQGGEGLVARIPISRRDESTGREEFWGMASVVMNSDGLFAGAGFQEERDGLRIAIRGRDALGAKGDVFFGDPSVFEQSPLTQILELPYGSWQIAAIPSAGWHSSSTVFTPLLWVYVLGAVTVLAFTAFIVFLLHKKDKMENEQTILARSLEVFMKETTDFVYYKDINSRFTFCSQTLADITNHTHWKEMIGKHDFDVFPHETATIYNEEEKPVFKEGKPVLNKVNPYYKENGETGYVQTNKWPVFDDKQKVIGIFGISRDITDHKKAVEDLENERNLFAAGPVFTMEWAPERDGKWPIKYASSNVEKILGFSPEEMMHPDFLYPEIIHPDDQDRIVNELKYNIANNIDTFETSYRLLTKTGDFIWVYDFTLLVRDGKGRLTAIRSYMYDQSAQKAAEEALRIAEARLERTAYELTENIPIGTYTMVQPPHGGMARFAFMSGRFLELTGLTREVAVSDPLKAFACVHPDDFDAWVALNAKAFEEKKPFFGETRVVANGEVRWITAESKPRTLADGTTVWEGVLADITDRKRAEEALEESLRRFSDLVAYMSVGVYVFWIRADGRQEFEYVSDGFCEMTGLRREDVLADPMVAFKMIHPEELENFILLNQDVARERKRFHWEGRVVIKGEVRFALLESNPVFFDNGDSRWFGIQQDITERVQDQERLLIARRQADAASRAKSEFLANMSHEIRTPMNGVIGMTGLLLDTELNETQRRYAETVRSSGQALLALLNDILDFSKIESGRLELEALDFDPRDLLDNFAISMAFKAEEKGLEFICAADPDVPDRLIGDPGRLRQILTNLVGNAVKFTERGEVVVRVSLVHGSRLNGSAVGKADGDVAVGAKNLSPDDVAPIATQSTSSTDPTVNREPSTTVQLCFTIRDTGIGIPPDKVDGLFESFTQVDASITRKFGGTGLGLAISKQLAEMMGGEVGVESVEGQGSTFWFTVRLGIGEAAQTPKPEAVDLHDVRVLIVDDNATNREILMTLCRGWGMRPDEALDGARALNLLHKAAAQGDPYRLAVLDMQMPGMDGETLGRVIFSEPALQPLPTVMLTSLGREGDPKRLREAGFSAHLTKPVLHGELFDCLTMVLARDKAAPGDLITRRRDRTTAGPRRDFSRSNARVLLAEDNPTNQQVILAMLDNLGLSADAVANGVEAVQALQSIPYDLVLMDVQMPVMDGLAATREIRKKENAGMLEYWNAGMNSGETNAISPSQIDQHKLDPTPFPKASRHSSIQKSQHPDIPASQHSRIPIIALTAHAMQGYREQCLGTGMDDYLAKPLEPVQLAEILDKWLPRQAGDQIARGEENKPGDGDRHSEIHPQQTATRNLEAGEDAQEDPDLAIFNKADFIRRMSGKRELTAKILRGFQQESRKRMEHLHQVVAEGDTTAIGNHAHALKGTALLVSAQALADQSSRLEQAGKAGDLAACRAVMQRVEREYQRLITVLESE